jgi:hypothetical protein
MFCAERVTAHHKFSEKTEDFSLIERTLADRWQKDCQTTKQRFHP